MCGNCGHHGHGGGYGFGGGCGHGPSLGCGGHGHGHGGGCGQHSSMPPIPPMHMMHPMHGMYGPHDPAQVPVSGEHFAHDPRFSPSANHALHIAYNSPNRGMVEAAVKDYILAATDSSLYSSGEPHVGHLAHFAKDSDLLAIIVDVIAARLDLEWPHNYKALEAAGALPPASLIKKIDKIEKLATPANGVYGQVEIRTLARPLLAKVKAEKTKEDNEKAEKKRKAVMGMWGGLWSDEPRTVPATISFPTGGYPPFWQHPNPFKPPAAGPSGWAGKPPEGWKPWSPDANRPAWGFMPNYGAPPGACAAEASKAGGGGGGDGRMSSGIPWSRSMYIGMHGEDGKPAGRATWFFPEKK